jgi:hypothetical protein
MCVVMLPLPLTSVLGHSPARLGLLAVMPLVIVAVVVTYMAGQGSR